jgi:hypothetical protein
MNWPLRNSLEDIFAGLDPAEISSPSWTRRILPKPKTVVNQLRHSLFWRSRFATARTIAALELTARTFALWHRQQQSPCTALRRSGLGTCMVIAR